MIRLQLFVFPILLLPTTLALLAFEGMCPTNITSVGDLDMERFLGKWYTYAVYPSFSKRVPRCQSAEFTKTGKNQYSVKSTELSTKTETLKVKVKAIKNVDPSLGKFDIDIENEAFPDGIQMYVLDTDYDTYAVRYLCFGASNIFSFHWAVIQTRQRLPRSDVVFTAQTLARAAGIRLSKMIKIPQRTCPPDA